MLVRDRMSAHPVTVRSDADYKSALKLMNESSLHHLPVLDASNRLVGIVAERDLLLAASQHLQSVIEIGEVMHRDVVTATRDMPVAEAAALMVNQPDRRAARRRRPAERRRRDHRDRRAARVRRDAVGAGHLGGRKIRQLTLAGASAPASVHFFRKELRS